MMYTIKKSKIPTWGYEITAKGFRNIAPSIEMAKEMMEVNGDMKLLDKVELLRRAIGKRYYEEIRLLVESIPVHCRVVSPETGVMQMVDVDVLLEKAMATRNYFEIKSLVYALDRKGGAAS